MNFELKSKPRLLVAIASYGAGNDRYLARLVKEYQSMQFDVDIVVLSNAPKDVAPGVEVMVVDLKVKNPWSLPFPHKQLFADRIDDYDLFLYSENDTLVTERNLRAFLEVSAALPEEEIPGFLRYEEMPDGGRNFPEAHGHFHWDPQSVRSRGGYTLAFFTNEHAACYVLTREQLRRAISSGGFLVEAHQGKYDLLCTCATDPYTQCGFRKLICISRIDDFLIHHLPNKYVGTAFGVDEPEMRRQVEALVRVGSNGHRPTSLFETETKLTGGAYSKDYYEPVRQDVLQAVPLEANSFLSIGCGSGATEGALAASGKRVVAIPLDPVIPGEASAKGVEIICGEFEAAWQRLAGQSFDCVLVLNVLHLVPDPIDLLNNVKALLSKRGVALLLTPNMLQLSRYRKKIRDEGNLRDLNSYSNTGVHLTSSKIVRGWLKEAELDPARTINVLPASRQRVRGLAVGPIERWLSSEFIVVGKRT